MKSWTIVGYSYAADIYCPEHALAAVLADEGIEGHGLSYIVEEALDRLAKDRGIDRHDERTFDSDDFPKVIFADQVENENERCNVCGESLISA